MSAFRSGGKLKGLGAALEAGFQFLDVSLNHEVDQLREGYGRFPVQGLPCFRGIRTEVVDLSRPKVARVNLHVLLPIQAGRCKGKFDEFAHRMGLSGADHVAHSPNRGARPGYLERAFAELHT